MNLLLLLTGCICLHLNQVNAYGSGAPAAICKSMLPHHIAYPQESIAPYKLSVEPQNGGFEVSLKTTEPGEFFLGFFIQARERDNPGVLADGEFSPTENARFVNCDGEKKAITHDSNVTKTEITTTWTPRQGYTKNIIFRATVVKTVETFWTEIYSEPFEISSSRDTFYSGITEKPGATDDQMLLKYEKCSRGRGCFGMPNNCVESKNCAILFSYFYDFDKTLVQFEISRKIDSDFEGWIAAGLSEDNIMGSDSVGDCIVINGEPSFHYSWNRGKSNQIEDMIPEINSLSATVTDGVLSCSWTREIESVENEITFNLLTNSYHILLARGLIKSLSPLEKRYHEERLPSNIAVNFTSIVGTN